MDNKLKVCRLCLEGINGLNFKALDSAKLAMLKILPLNLNPAYTTNAFICFQCFENLQQIFFFKKDCLKNNDYLKTFLHNDSNFTLVLEEVITRQISSEDGSEYEENVCRFCLQYFETNWFTKLNKLEEDVYLKNMFEKCLPELDLNMTKAPLMCMGCMDLLHNQFNFMMCYLQVEERINNFRSSVGDQHDLSDILQFERKPMGLGDIKLKRENDDSTEYVSDLVVKKEEVFEDIGESEFHIEVKENLESDMEHEDTVSEESIKIEENLKTELNPTETTSDSACKSGLVFPKPEMLEKNAHGMFACTFCPHQTNRRDSLVIHFLTHREKTEVSQSNQFHQFKCTECDFVTNYKASLKLHVNLHKNPTELELFYCAKCSYKSMHKKHVRRHCKTHMKSTLLSTDIYQCQFCSFTTKYKNSFQQHNKIKHGKNIILAEKMKLNCEKCDYQSKFERNIFNHMKIVHNIVIEEDKPVQIYECEWCDYKTPKLCRIQNHSLKHQSSNDVKMLNCPQCSFQTKYKNSLTKHVKRHESGWKPQKRRTNKPGTSGRKSS